MKKLSLGVPDGLRRDLILARQKRKWSQAKLGEQVGLPQAHISGIESGKVVPRFDTLLEIVRVLNYDLLLVPRNLVPIVQALTQGDRNPLADLSEDDDDDRPLYQPDGDEE